MKTSIHLPKEISSRLDRHMKLNELTSKNKIIVDAIVDYLDKIETQNSGWSPEFLAWADREPDKEGLEIDRTDTWREIEL